MIVGDACTDETQKRIKQAIPSINLMIDDGSHQSKDIIGGFLRYFPQLSVPGLYIAEDLPCSYWKSHGGGLFHPASAMAFFRALIDILNYEHWGIPPQSSVQKNNHRKEKKEPIHRKRLLKQLCDFHRVQHLLTEDLEKSLACMHSVTFINSLCIIHK